MCLLFPNRLFHVLRMGLRLLFSQFCGDGCCSGIDKLVGFSQTEVLLISFLTSTMASSSCLKRFLTRGTCLTLLVLVVFRGWVVLLPLLDAWMGCSFLQDKDSYITLFLAFDFLRRGIWVQHLILVNTIFNHIHFTCLLVAHISRCRSYIIQFLSGSILFNSSVGVTVSGSCWYHLSIITISRSLQMLQCRYVAAL